MRRHAGAFLLLLLTCCTGAPVPPAAKPAGDTSASTSPGSPSASPGSPAAAALPAPTLRLTLDRPSMEAGSCVTATVRARGLSGPRVGLQMRDASGRWRPTPGTARFRQGRASIRACVGWTGSGLESVRAVAAGARPSPALPITLRPAAWMSDMDRLIGGLPASASLVVDGAALYGHGADVPRQPASNEKLLLTMTALDELGPGFRIPTVAAAKAATGGVVPGDLWLIGHGDPGLDAVGLRRLARRIRTFGIQRVTGSVVGDTSEFRRDRGAPGWHPIALRFIGLPTALSYEHNVDAGGFVFDPEERAAAALTADLRGLGIRVGGAPRAAGAPAHILTLARVRSAPLADILTLQNAVSDNLDAETLSKLLGARERGRGSIAGGARVIQGWANDRGAGVRIFDASGLSYRDRVTTSGLAELLDGAQAERWGTTFRDTLPAPGEGTLAGRLGGLPVRAKTGTLIQHVSALSGYVRLADGRWGSFSILSRLPKDRAVALEDAIVRVFAASG